MKYRIFGLPAILSAILLFWSACGGASGSSLSTSGHTGASGSASPSPAAPAGGSGSASTTRLFPNAAWLYTAPIGGGMGLANYHAKVTIDTHDGGYDYPVQYADGSHGTMTFTDGRDTLAVPIPSGGFYPSTGGYGFNDGHLVVIDLQQRRYYDFWKLIADGHGHPRSTRVGKIVAGSLDGNGVPGTTAANVTGAAGDLLPGELQSGINHALSCVIPGNWNNASLGHQFPATKTDGTSNGALSEGGKLGIAPNVNVDALPVGAGTKKLMKALQRYGCAITDQSGGSGVAIYSSLPSIKGLDMSGMSQIGGYLRFYF